MTNFAKKLKGLYFAVNLHRNFKLSGHASFCGSFPHSTFNKSYLNRILMKRNGKFDNPQFCDKWSVLLEFFRSKKPLPRFLINVVFELYYFTRKTPLKK